jgi:hypothetical protein
MLLYKICNVLKGFISRLWLSKRQSASQLHLLMRLYVASLAQHLAINYSFGLLCMRNAQISRNFAHVQQIFWDNTL